MILAVGQSLELGISFDDEKPGRVPRPILTQAGRERVNADTILTKLWHGFQVRLIFLLRRQHDEADPTFHEGQDRQRTGDGVRALKGHAAGCVDFERQKVVTNRLESWPEFTIGNLESAVSDDVAL